jgi:hypothetical protein
LDFPDLTTRRANKIPVIDLEIRDVNAARDEILPQLDVAELPIAPLLVPVEEHAIPESLWTALRESFRA